MNGNSFTDVDPFASARAQAAGIFLSYRRRDPDARVGRLYDRLVTRFGAARVFRDVDDAEPGANFEDKIDHALSASRILIAVIGPTWETVTNSRGERRLDNPKDYVRHEIAQALRNDDCAVLPVLWGPSTMMPAAEDLPEELRPLVTIQAIRVEDDDGQRFEFDAQQVVTAVARIVGEPESRLGPDIVLTPPDLVMDPGLSGQIAVVARNVDAIATDVALTYDGPDWARLGPDIDSRAGERELRNSLTVSPPRRSDLPPRAWSYAIELRDRRTGHPLARASGTLTTVAFRDTHVNLEPARVETRRSSSLTLTVRNGGNVNLHGRVETKAETLNHASPDRITLQPGAEETYPVSVSAPTRRLFGRAIEHPVTVAVAVQGEPERHERHAIVRQRPLLPAGVVLLVATILVALGGFGVWKAQQAEARILPDVVGMTESAARAYLEKIGFDPDSIDSRRQDADATKDDVVRTFPERGTEVSSGDRIQLFVGDGSDLVVVPNVIGKSLADAEEVLKANGFTKIKRTEQVTATAEEVGKVVKTHPEAEVQALPEQEIEIFVGEAPSGGTETGGSGGGTDEETDTPNGLYTIPDVSGLPWEEAEEELKEEHFVPSAAREPSDTVPVDLVISTDPPAHESRPGGTEVTVYVSTGAELVTFPVQSVVGMDETSARQALEEAGLVVDTHAVDDCSAVGIVTDQDPPAPEQVEEGAIVTITVAQAPPEGCDGGG